MRLTRLFVPALGAALLALAACSKSEPTETTSTNGAADAALPAALFAGAAPTDARPLIEVKADAAVGDEIVFEARVGGRAKPFVENRAVFFVTDASLLDCSQIHGDSCRTPWDYCCEPPENLRAHMATVQVVDASGAPLKVAIEGAHAIEPLRTVVVTGLVTEAGDGAFVVDARTIHVRPLPG